MSEVVMVTIRSKYVNPPVCKPVHVFEESPVELGIYQPISVQVQRFIDAGERLYASRAEAYDTDIDSDDPDDYYDDPTRSPNFDLADASLLASQARQGLRRSAERAEAEKKAKEAAEAQEKAEKAEKAALEKAAKED